MLFISLSLLVLESSVLSSEGKLSRLRTTSRTNGYHSRAVHRDLNLQEDVIKMINEEATTFLANSLQQFSFPDEPSTDDETKKYCTSAFVYCDGLSTCSNENLNWQMSLVHALAEAFLPVTCEIRMGDGKCLPDANGTKSEHIEKNVTNTTEYEPQYGGNVVGSFIITNETVNGYLNLDLHVTNFDVIGLDNHNHPVDSLTIPFHMEKTPSENSVASSFVLGVLPPMFRIHVEYISLFFTICNCDVFNGGCEEELNSDVPTTSPMTNVEVDSDSPSIVPLSATFSPSNFHSSVTSNIPSNIPSNIATSTRRTASSGSDFPSMDPTTFDTGDAVVGLPTKTTHFDPIIPVIDNDTVKTGSVIASAPRRLSNGILGTVFVAVVATAVMALYFILRRRRNQYRRNYLSGAFDSYIQEHSQEY